MRTNERDCGEREKKEGEGEEEEKEKENIYVCI